MAFKLYNITTPAPPVVETSFYAPLSSSVDATASDGSPTGTFTRASTAYARNATTGYYESKSVDAPRFEDTDDDNTADALLLEPGSTNVCLKSRDVTDVGSWIRVNSPIINRNQTGIDGVSNTACYVEDNGSSHEYFYQDISITAANQYNTISVFILKDSNETVFPALRVSYLPGSALNIRILLNTKTGATRADGSVQDLPITHGSIDRGLWWQFWLCAENTTRGTLRAMFHIAGNTSWADGISAAAQRSVVVDNFQVELDKQYPSSPIFTDTSSVSRATEATPNLSWSPTDNIDTDADGTIYLEAMVPVDDPTYTGFSDLVWVTSTGRNLLHVESGGQLGSFNAASLTSAWTAGQWKKIVVRWKVGTNALQVIADGTAGSEVAYDLPTQTVLKMRYDNPPTNNANPIYIREFKVYDGDKGEAWGISETS
jgi:hypothetical protein